MLGLTGALLLAVHDELACRPVRLISLADDGPGRGTVTVLSMAANEVCHRLCYRDWHCMLILPCAILAPCKTLLHTDLSGS